MKVINRQEVFRLDYVPVAETAAGEVIVVGAIRGYTTNPLAAGAQGTIVVYGLADVVKKTAEAWSKGDYIYYDSAAGNFTKVATGNYLVGAAESDAAEADEVARVFWNPAVNPAVTPSDAIVDITDNSGGTPGDTIAAISDVAGAANGIASNSAKVNAILAVLRDKGLLASS